MITTTTSTVKECIMKQIEIKIIAISMIHNTIHATSHRLVMMIAIITLAIMTMPITTDISIKDG